MKTKIRAVLTGLRHRRNKPAGTAGYHLGVCGPRARTAPLQPDQRQHSSRHARAQRRRSPVLHGHHRGMDLRRHPLDSRCMELFKLPQERGESIVQYSNRILDIADECDLNDITQQEIMAMVFITHCRSPQFRQELRRHGVGGHMAIHQERGAGMGQI